MLVDAVMIYELEFQRVISQEKKIIRHPIKLIYMSSCHISDLQKNLQVVDKKEIIVITHKNHDEYTNVKHAT